MIDLPELDAAKKTDLQQAAVEQMRRKPKHRVADKLLHALRSKHPGAYRCHPEDPHKWTAACPACGEPLGIAEQPWGKWQVLLFCSGGCDDQTILKALADDSGDREHAAMLAAQTSIVEAEFARRNRARHARRELQAWQSTTKNSPNISAKTIQPPSAPVARGGPSSPDTTPVSPPSATTSPRPPTSPTDGSSTKPSVTAATPSTPSPSPSAPPARPTTSKFASTPSATAPSPGPFAELLAKQLADEAG